MSKKSKILIISYAGAAVIALAGAAWALFGTAGSYRAYNDTEYRRAMSMLVTSMEDLDSALQKGQYATGTVVTGKVCAQMYASAQSASTALSILPVDQYELEEVASFISQVEDYAGAKVAAAADGVAFDDADRQTAGQLAEITGGLTDALSAMYEDLCAGAMTIRGPELKGLTANISDETGPVLEDGLYQLAGDFPQTPELVYEGKYSSDHTETWTGLQGASPVNEEEALETVLTLLEVPEDAVTAMGKSKNEAPAYYFSVERAEETATVAVTEAGGYLMLYVSDRAAAGENIPEDEARKAAEDFVTRAGYKNLTAYEERRDWGILEVTYVSTADEITSLADTVKVSVSLEDGRILSFNASEYLKNHTDHAPVDPAVSREEAERTAIPAGLTVESVGLSYYTAESGRTDLCWRFRCTTEEGETCLIYASAETGRQVEIVTDTKTLIT